ncbi:FixH family protein [Virgibacillus senegalensis]|uniref:FixH family protein n=1 Tax=Virgibacillus senegalensis TaxID=1499679 RepID=UPI001F3D3BBC|nr:FixH family protein [Virgibacillus senegalensis]
MLWLLFVSFLTLTACGQSDNQGSGSDGETTEPQPIEVALQVPEQAESGDSVSLTAKVTQGGENVEDAEEVEFEVWQEGTKEESELIEAEYQGDGIYGIEKSFEVEGTYVVQSHVTARQMHIMPKKSLVIGDSDTTKVNEGEHGQDSHEDSDHHHADGLTVQLDSPEAIKVHEDSKMTVSINQEDEPLTGANVTLEISFDENENPQWIDLNEEDSGSYTGNVTFAHPGSHAVNIHVKKGELHSHQETAIEVEE